MARHRPVIGVTTYLTDAAWSYWHVPAALVPAAYVRAVVEVGGSPLLVPPGAGVDETLDAVDGLVFSGGSDLDPELYSASAHEQTNGIVRERDDFELELMQAALARDLPVLAICRGSQILNVARGGGIEQHLPDTVGTQEHRPVPGTFGEHAVAVDERSKLGSIVGAHTAVKSHHHQGFGEIGAGLVATAKAEDGTVEGLEDPGKRFALGVLWHPEEGEDLALFAALVDAAGGESPGRVV